MLATVITPENAAEHARDLDVARRALEQQRRDVEAQRQGIAARQRQLEELEGRI